MEVTFVIKAASAPASSRSLQAPRQSAPTGQLLPPEYKKAPLGCPERGFSVSRNLNEEAFFFPDLHVLDAHEAGLDVAPGVLFIHHYFPLLPRIQSLHLGAVRHVLWGTRFD